MFYVDIPPESIQVAVSQVASGFSEQPYFVQGNRERLSGVEAVIGVCNVIPPGKIAAQSLGSAGYDLSPRSTAVFYLENHLNIKLSKNDKIGTQLTLIAAPQYGSVVPDEKGIPNAPNYHPNPNFWGVDRLTYVVEMAGHKLQLEYFLSVGLGGGACTNGDKDYVLPFKIPGKIPTHGDKNYPVRDLTININTNIDIARSDLPGQSLGTITVTKK